MADESMYAYIIICINQPDVFQTVGSAKAVKLLEAHTPNHCKPHWFEVMVAHVCEYVRKHA